MLTKSRSFCFREQRDFWEIKDYYLYHLTDTPLSLQSLLFVASCSYFYVALSWVKVIHHLRTSSRPFTSILWPYCFKLPKRPMHYFVHLSIFPFVLCLANFHIISATCFLIATFIFRIVRFVFHILITLVIPMVLCVFTNCD